jgi:hypothetical protein
MSLLTLLIQRFLNYLSYRISFLPISFLVQFTRVVNVFYFTFGMLQLVPSIATNNPLAIYLPLAFVVVMGMIKEGVVEYKRYKQDKETNSRVTVAYDEE